MQHPSSADLCRCFLSVSDDLGLSRDGSCLPQTEGQDRGSHTLCPGAGQGNQEAQAALSELSEDVRQLRVVEEEITGYAEQALEETERLKQENEDLRKAAEDAALDRYMNLYCSACINT